MSHRKSLVLASAFSLIATIPLTPAQDPPGACLAAGPGFATLEGGCKDLFSSLVWSAPAGTLNWSDAMAYAEGLVEGGYSDWRLPTIGELQAAYANGGYTHLNVLQGHLAPWSSTKVKPNSNSPNFEVWCMFWDTGAVIKAIRTSRKYFNCVRQGSSSLLAAGDGAPVDRPAASEPVRHVVQDGTWTVGIHLPTHARAAFGALVVSARAAGSPAAPIQRLPALDLAPNATGAVATKLGSFDATGRATVVVRSQALALTASVLQDLAILLVVADPRSAEPVLYRIRLPH